MVIIWHLCRIQWCLLLHVTTMVYLIWSNLWLPSFHIFDEEANEKLWSHEFSHRNVLNFCGQVEIITHLCKTCHNFTKPSKNQCWLINASMAVLEQRDLVEWGSSNHQHHSMKNMEILLLIRTVSIMKQSLVNTSKCSVAVQGKFPDMAVHIQTSLECLPKLPRIFSWKPRRRK